MAPLLSLSSAALRPSFNQYKTEPLLLCFFLNLLLVGLRGLLAEVVSFLFLSCRRRLLLSFASSSTAVPLSIADGYT